MTSHPYVLDPTSGAKATLGLIVLQVDETIETEMRRLLPQPDINLYVSRVPSGEDLTHDTIQAMADDLPRAASLLPQSPTYNAVGYACTSGATLLGPERVADLVRSACRTDVVLDPLSAVLAECRLHDIRSVAMVSPYTEDIGAPVATALTEGGISVAKPLHFGEATEANVARIAATSVREAAISVTSGESVDAVFLSCTNLRTLDLIQPLEAELGVPVLSSNLALARAMARVAGQNVVLPNAAGSS